MLPGHAGFAVDVVEHHEVKSFKLLCRAALTVPQLLVGYRAALK